MFSITVNLQCFNNVPPELEGLSQETIKEIMKEIEQDQGESSSPPDSSDLSNDQDAGQDADKGDQSEDSAANADADSETKQSAADDSRGNDPGPIPYKRFKEINDKNRQLEAEIEKLKKSSVSSQNNQTNTNIPIAQQNPPVQPPGQQKEQTDTQSSPHVSSEEYEKVLNEEAAKRFEKKYNKPFDDEFATVGDVRNFMRITMEIEGEVNRYVSEHKAAQERQQGINQEYLKMADTLKANPNAEALFQFATTEKFNTLSPLYQQALNDAYSRAERGQGTAQDIILLQEYFTQAAQEFEAKQSTPPANQASQETQEEKAKKTVQKSNQMEAHPRISNLKGQSSSGELTESEISKMLNTMEWKDIPPEIQKRILTGQI